MDKRRFANSMSAFVLLAFAIIWLVYLCAGNHMSPKVASGLSLSVSILSFLTYLIKVVFSHKTMPRWLVAILLLAMFGTIPATIIDLLKSNHLDLTIFPIVQQIFYISQRITFIILYVVLAHNAFIMTDSLIFRIIFITIAAFLIFCCVVQSIPPLAAKMNFPLIGFVVG